MFKKVIRSAELISLPEIYLKLKDLLEDPEYTMAEVALLVGSDPGMAARFLRIANSPLYRRACKIETVSHAVSLLGVRQVQDIVLSASVAEAFEGIETKVMNMKRFWQRSFYCAVMSKQFAMVCELTEIDRLFVAGLLHDIGHLFMFMAIPEESQHAILMAKNLERPLWQMERELLGFDYAKLGGYMMRQWDFPNSLQLITWRHPEPCKADQFGLETALLHLSSLLVRSDLEQGVFGEGPFTVDSTVWATINLTEEHCLNIRQKAADEFSEVVSNFFF